MLRRRLTTVEANTGTVRIWCPAENAPLCMWLQPSTSREVCTLISAGGWRWRGRGSAEGVCDRIGKGLHSTKDVNPYGWLALGRDARGRGYGRSSDVHLVGRGSVLITNTGVPYKVYNSVPVVLYLKPFRTTWCTN